MATLIMQTTPFVDLAKPWLRSVGVRLRRALDKIVEARMRNAIPAHQLRKAQQEIDRYRRLTAGAGAKSPGAKSRASVRKADRPRKRGNRHALQS